MIVNIHRGQNQIGGCITEIATAKTRIFIDLGGNLPSNDGEADPLATPEAVAKLTEGVDAIFYTHYHGDHVGLFHLVPESVHQYIGRGAWEVMRSPLLALSKVDAECRERLARTESFRTFSAGEPVAVGDIRVTPFFCSHSAYDAYMFLVEADGKRILHTGDFNGHGYMSAPWVREKRNIIDVYIKPIDVLITEGTMLGRRDEGTLTEWQLQSRLKGLLATHKYVFLLCSSTNIDRLASVYHACRKTGRLLVCDTYQQGLYQTFHRLAGHNGRIYQFSRKQYDFLKRGRALPESQFQYMKDKGFCVLVRGSQCDTVQQIVNRLGRENCQLVYSLWKGYYTQPSAQMPDIMRLRDLFPEENITYLHTSGHADCDTLRKVIQRAQPKEAIIGIHKEAGTSLNLLNLPENLKARIVPDDVDQITL